MSAVSSSAIDPASKPRAPRPRCGRGDACGVPPETWWSNLGRVPLAVEDLDGEALLDA